MAGDMGSEVSGGEINEIGGAGELSDIAKEVMSGEVDTPLDDLAPDPTGYEEDDDIEDVPPLIVKGKEEGFELKVKGKTHKVKNLDELKAAAQRGLAMQQNYEEFKRQSDSMRSELENQKAEVQAMIDQAKKDPAKFFKSHNDKAEDIAEQLLLDKAREWEATQNMTPRERDLYFKNKEYQEKLAAQEEAETKRSDATNAELVRQQENQIGAVFSEALQKHGVPKSTISVRVMAGIYRANLSKGIELTPEQAAGLTKQQLGKIFSEAYGELDPAEFIKLMPKTADRIRAHYANQAKGKPRSQEVGEVPMRKAGTKPTRRRDPDEIDDEAWERSIKKMKAEGSAMRVKKGWG